MELLVEYELLLCVGGVWVWAVLYSKPVSVSPPHSQMLGGHRQSGDIRKKAWGLTAHWITPDHCNQR